MADRYAATGAEAEFEPGSRRRVLRNLLGIRSVREMERAESAALVSTTRKSIDETGADQRFTADHIRHLHRAWLDRIYPWAGQYRSVNLSKGDFPFAGAPQIPRLMERLEREQLHEFTPCRGSPDDDVPHSLAAVHVELILIHPFRDGNGRRRRYFDAVHAAMAGNLAPMMLVFERIIAKTLRKRRS